ncbi:MAG: hypothetical protein WBA77_15410 [Microcoleaceae cyanobacterium]
MRSWHWWQTLVASTQYNPPQFIEMVMLILAIFLLFSWSITGSWPYLVLCLSYVVGSSSSMLIREVIAPPHRFQPTTIIAILLLLMGIYILVDYIF